MVHETDYLCIIIVWLFPKSVMTHCINECIELNYTCVYQQQQNLGRRFSTSKMHLPPPPPPPGGFGFCVLLLFIYCLLLVPLVVGILCLVLVLLCSNQYPSLSSWWGREIWLLYLSSWFLWPLLFCGSS